MKNNIYFNMLRDLRTNYQKFELTEQSAHQDPFQQLISWLGDAIEEQKTDSNAMVLSTIDLQGNPDSRVVLLKELTSEGLVFFTNYSSHKGQQISANNHVSALFFWPGLERQVRIKGKAEKIDEKDSELYFKSRPIESQLGAWASPQSQVIESRQLLSDQFRHYEQFFESHEIKKPPFWGGYLIRPIYFEFWQGRTNRLHDRLAYILSDHSWQIQRLAP